MAERTLLARVESARRPCNTENERTLMMFEVSMLVSVEVE